MSAALVRPLQRNGANLRTGGGELEPKVRFIAIVADDEPDPADSSEFRASQPCSP